MNLELVSLMSEYQRKKCRTFFSIQKTGDFIYAGHLKSKLCINIKEAYLILEELKRMGYLKTIYEVYCSCGHSKGIFLESITDFDTDWCCDWCNRNLNPMEDIIVLYKVV